MSDRRQHLLGPLPRFAMTLSSIAPIFLFAMLICFFKNNFKYIHICALFAIVFFLFGFFGLMCFRFAIEKGETLSLNRAIISIEPVRGWASTLIGTYLIPFLTLPFDFGTCCLMVGIAIIVSLILQLCNDIPPVIPLKLIGYRFYNVGLEGGSCGYWLITKRRAIHDPGIVTSVVYFSNKEYWLIEKVG